MNQTTKHEILNKIYDNIPPNYKLLYVTIMGSKLYGTNSENSDTDIKFIFMPSIEDCILGIASTNININSSSDKEANTKNDIDIQGWSIKFFIELLKKGDTNAIDVLYSQSNKDALIYISDDIQELFDNPLDFYDVSNLRGLIGYVVSQSEKYGLKGKRYKVFEEILDIIKYFKKTDHFTSSNGSCFQTLSEISQMIFDKCGHDPAYCKLETTEDGRDAIRICGKVHILSISITEFEHRIFTEYSRYGARSKEALDGSDWKALYHAYRTILEAKELIKNDSITFPLSQAKYLKEIKAGKIDREELNYLISIGLDDVNTYLKNIKPKKINVHYTQNFILNLYGMGN